MAASTSSGFHTYSSWGRTRRPKNVNGATSTAFAAHDTWYNTENQRYLHVQVGATATVTNIELYYHGSEAISIFKSGAPHLAANGHAIYEIAGADRVRIQGTGDGSTAAKSVFLMLSTF